jgi:hypothetical protein
MACAESAFTIAGQGSAAGLALLRAPFCADRELPLGLLLVNQSQSWEFPSVSALDKLRQGFAAIYHRPDRNAARPLARTLAGWAEYSDTHYSV